MRPDSLKRVDSCLVPWQKGTIDQSPDTLETRPGAPPFLYLGGVFLLMFVAQCIGSIFNIQYNLTHLTPLFSEDQQARFGRAIGYYNAIAYPILVLYWAVMVFSLRKIPTSDKGRSAMKRRVINLPIISVAIAAIGWILCIPVLLISLGSGVEPINPHVYFHLPMSVGISTFISLTIGYFSIDWVRQILLFPYFFRDESPSQTQGAFRLSIAGRGGLWTVAASICPILALLLLFLSPSPDTTNFVFAIGVALVGIVTALVSSALMSKLIAQPVEELRNAAQRVGNGELNLEVDTMRADEFGVLADEFNAMISGLREKERISSTFGRHVGKQIAHELLEAGEELSGVERELSVLFADIRGFTTRCETIHPKEAVRLLNLYHTAMTEIIEENHGIVVQLIGDGIMALFGATGADPNYANHAVDAATEMIRGLESLNTKLESEGFEKINIGVGVNTGRAVVGTIGSSRRKEYTAIGDTVNTAARIEGLTKEMGTPILLSESTIHACDPAPAVAPLDPVEIRGRANKILLYYVSD